MFVGINVVPSFKIKQFLIQVLHRKCYWDFIAAKLFASPICACNRNLRACTYMYTCKIQMGTYPSPLQLWKGFLNLLFCTHDCCYTSAVVDLQASRASCLRCTALTPLVVGVERLVILSCCCSHRFEESREGGRRWGRRGKGERRTGRWMRSLLLEGINIRGYRCGFLLLHEQ